MAKTLERRHFKADLEVRQSDGKPVLRGYASIFNAETDIGEFREVVVPGAFKRTLQTADVRALWNHSDSRPPLGRTRAGTLKLEEDNHGLKVEIHPPDSAADVVEAIRRGDVSQMSFGFRVVRDEWEDQKGGKRLRRLKEVELFDVSPVVFPAYSETEISARALAAAKKKYDPAVLRRQLDKLSSEIREADVKREARQDAAFNRLLEPKPVEGTAHTAPARLEPTSSPAVLDARRAERVGYLRRKHGFGPVEFGFTPDSLPPSGSALMDATRRAKRAKELRRKYGIV